MINFANKTVAVAGFGVEGKSTAAWLKKHKANVVVLDQNPDTPVMPDYDFKLGKTAFDQLNGFDYVFRTAGLRPEKLKCEPSKILSAYRVLLIEHANKIIGVTGTKGKGTTSTLIYKILRTADIDVYLAGNIGQNPLEFMDELTNESVVVMELSSFQLFDATQSPHAGVVLMVEPDHLDWHKDMDEYIEAKKNLIRYQNNTDLAVYNPQNNNSAAIAKDFPWALPYLKGAQGHIRDGYVCFAEVKILPIDQVGLIGPHNLQNICAAVTATWHFLKERGLDEHSVVAAIKTAVIDFKGLPHRLELCAVKNDITYINDTFSASPVALSAALRSFSQHTVPIVGGFDKKLGIKQIVESLVEHVAKIRHVVLIGQTAESIAKALESANIANYSILPLNTDMKTIVSTATQHAQDGDVVLLSPGHASFDMFKNYKDRGEQFRKAVKEL